MIQAFCRAPREHGRIRRSLDMHVTGPDDRNEHAHAQQDGARVSTRAGEAQFRVSSARSVPWGSLDVAEADGLGAVYVFVHPGLSDDALAGIRDLAERAWSTHRIVFRTTAVQSSSFARLEMSDEEERPSPSPSVPKTG